MLDLKAPENRDLLLALCETADVFVETFRPGVADRLGLGYAALSARNPRLVYCSISAFGQHGAYRRPAGARSCAGGDERRAQPDARRRR